MRRTKPKTKHSGYRLLSFTLETWQRWQRSDRGTVGAKQKQLDLRGNPQAGDRLVCYLLGHHQTQGQRWFGILEVASGPPFATDPTVDPDYPIRIQVKHIILLNDPESGVYRKDPDTVAKLSFGSKQQALQGSLRELQDGDGRCIEDSLMRICETE